MIEYLEDVIGSYNSYIDKIESGSLLIAELLREDRTAEAFHIITDFSEGITWLMQAAELLQKNNVHLELEIMKMNEFLEEINGGLEIQDFVLVADLFEYEIAPFFERCTTIEVPQN
ncbi:hypothetical protein JFL43_08155 [Viridibacillus sp. YIM B01967]|uniref:DUF8042 domain-containing protein n=1 Tax=Viridibacillus soli TaxID=2798301 RepID=A0ABS1H6R1_9BACL|nr:hypothetical protein [Viridibacillus soli]MBK3494832.1 hypothetical protein [Viridibacillus soli]